jgi:hypothetical protein
VRLSETQDDGDLLADLEGGKLDLTWAAGPRRSPRGTWPGYR